MRAKDHRRHIPVGVKLHSCLLLLGFTEEEITGGGIQWDHFPAITLRTENPDGTITPAVNDPRYIRPMRRAAHDIKTRGSGATTAGSDVGQGAKIRRIEKDPAGGEAFRRKLLAVKAGEKPDAPGKRKHQWPKGRKIQNRKKP